MDRRIELQKLLEKILGVDVYYQPPPSIYLKYPCALYSLSSIYTRNADDSTYIKTKRYTLTIIDLNPDSKLPEKVLTDIPMSTFDRCYTADNLNHWVFTFYY